MNVGPLLYSAANLVIALMLGCMLASAFVYSDWRFRLAAGLLAGASLGCMFLGLSLLSSAGAGERQQIGLLELVQIAQSIALGLVLVMMRLRQRAAGLHEHPRVRASDRLEGSDRFADMHAKLAKRAPGA